MCEDVKLIVPPCVETELSGFRLAAERTMHRSRWRVEFWNDQAVPRVFKNGNQMELSSLPDYARNFANWVNVSILSVIAR